MTMTTSLVAALELAFAEARDLKATLTERLNHVSQKVSRISPTYETAINAFIARLDQNNAGAMAPQIGEAMPGFILPDDQGRLVSLDHLLQTGPVAIAFHRGHWCPYCRLSAHGLAEIEEEVKPVQLVAISAETQTYTRMIKAEADAHFPFLTDIDNGYALSLNLAIWIDDSMASMIEAVGWEVPKFQGSAGWIVPIPSIFVVGQDGLITARHVDADYRRRLELDDLRAAALSALKGSTPSPATD